MQTTNTFRALAILRLGEAASYRQQASQTPNLGLRECYLLRHQKWCIEDMRRYRAHPRPGESVGGEQVNRQETEGYVVKGWARLP